MSVTMPDKELAELQRRFKRGYTVELQGNGHYALLDPSGEKVRNKQGRAIHFASTPKRGIPKALVRELTEADVLRETPTKRSRPHSTNGTSAPVDNRRVAWEAMNAARSQIRAEESKRLYDRLTPLVEKVGGWDQPGMTADLAHIGALIARETNKQTKTGVNYTPDLLVNSIHRVKARNWIEANYQELWHDLASRLEAAPNAAAEFFALIRRAKGLPETVVALTTQAKPQIGDWPFRVELLSLEFCHVDHSYQRPVDWLWVRKTAATFDPTLVGTLDVSERHHGGSYAIMDGQGRTESMKLVGKTQAYAAIYTGLDLQAEASFFLHKNSDRKAIHPFYTYQAKLTAKNPVAVAVQEITTKYGYEVSIISASNRNIPEKISAISSLEEAYNRKNDAHAECLSPTLAVMRKATFGLKEGNSAFLIRSVARMFERYEGIDQHRLADVIAERNPSWLLGRMREMGWSVGKQTPAMMAVLVEEYNRGLPRAEKLDKPR